MSCIGLVGMTLAGDRPVIAGLSPSVVWSIGLFATMAGSALFALATYRTQVLSRPGAGLLAVGSTVLFVIILAGFSGVEGTTAGPSAVLQFLMVVGSLMFSLGWIALGWAAIRLDRPATAAI